MREKARLWTIPFVMLIVFFGGHIFISATGSMVSDPPLMYTQPYLVSLQPMSSMSICWLTSQPTAHSYVEYGLDEKYHYREKAVTYEIVGLKTVDSTGKYTLDLPVYQQIVFLQGLQPGIRYYYRAVSETDSEKKMTRGYHFNTAPPPGHPLKFILLSDLQLGVQSPATVKMAGQQDADFIIYNGDFTNTPWKAGEWFTVPGTREEDSRRWFNVMQQTREGAQLLQYLPIFPSPGNHEVDQQELLDDKTKTDREELSLKIYMQLFRPLYPRPQYWANGKHWYSVDYGDMHIISLSVFRWFAWPAAEKPGWYLFDDVEAGSPQYKWLKKDLPNARDQKYKWITMHWHMFNRSHDLEVPFTDPVPLSHDPNRMTYPAEEDYLLRDLKPLLEKYGVNAVSYGHTHVYERYRINGIHYIEAASNGNNYRSPNDPPCSPNGYCPEFEENRFRSFLLVSVDPQKGITAQGIQASMETNRIGSLGRAFDSFPISHPNRSIQNGRRGIEKGSGVQG